MPYAAVRGILGVVPLEAPVQRQAHLASKVDPAVNLVLAVSTAQVAGSGLTAARRRGRAHERLGANEGTNDSDTRQLRLAHACARHTACTCSPESRPGWSRAASGSVTRSKGSPVAYRTAVLRARRVAILA